MLRGIALLLAFQAAGELLSHQLQLPISGAVCGMALLLAWLIARGKVPDDVTRVTDALLANMPVLFVPVGVGAMVYADVFQRHWAPIAFGVLAGTAITLAATAMVARYLAARRDRPAKREMTEPIAERIAP